MNAVIVPHAGAVSVEATDDPAVWFAASTSVPGRRYRVGGIGTAAPFCTCPAIKHCKHITAVLIAQEDLMDELEALPEAVGQTTAVAIAPRNVTSIDARRAAANGSQAVQLAAAAQLQGYSTYLLLAQQMGDTGLLPASIDTAQKAAVVFMKAAELGIPPMAALELFYVVGNKVGIQGQMIQALIERSGKGYVEIVESTDERAVVIGHREGRPPMRVEWTPDDALRAGTTLKGDKVMGGWKDKLVWKAVARIGRRMFADVLGGMDVGDGQGIVIDESPIAGEYRASIDTAPPAPAEEPQKAPAPPWMPEFRTVVKEAGLSLAPFYAYFDTPTPQTLIPAIDEWLAADTARTPASLVSAVADWDAAGRPARTAPVAPPEDAQEAMFTDLEGEG